MKMSVLPRIELPTLFLTWPFVVGSNTKPRLMGLRNVHDALEMRHIRMLSFASGAAQCGDCHRIVVRLSNALHIHFVIERVPSIGLS